MHRSIIGLTDAIQSIADGKSVLKNNDNVKQVKRKLESVEVDIAANHRITEANCYYAEMEDCTARIAAKLREIDNIDLNMYSRKDDDDDDPVSNQMRFIDDQCFRAQAMLSGEYYLRNLNTFDSSKEIAEFDERVNYTTKNWKHALEESELAYLKPPEVEANKEKVVEKTGTLFDKACLERRIDSITEENSRFQQANDTAGYGVRLMQRDPAESTDCIRNICCDKQESRDNNSSSSSTSPNPSDVQTQRQEITLSVFDPLPRPVAIPYATCSEASDKSVLNKAQQMLASLQTPAAASSISNSEVVVPPPTNSSPSNSAKLKFADESNGSTLSSSELKLVFRADVESADTVDNNFFKQCGDETEKARGYDPPIQHLLVEHTTDECLTKQKEVRVTHSLHEISLTQEGTERKVDLSPRIGTPKFVPLEEDMESNRPVSIDPELQSEQLSAIVASNSAAQDAMGEGAISNKRALKATRKQNRARRKLKNMNRPKLPLCGMATALQRREQPALQAQLMGFSKHIDSGLVTVSAHEVPSSQSTSSGTVQRPSAPKMTAGALIYDGALRREGMLPDLFGQQHIAVLREHIRHSMLTKGSRKHSDREQRRLSEVVDQFMLSHFGGTEFYPESVQQVPTNFSDMDTLSSDPIAHKAAVRELHRHLSSVTREGAQSAPGYIKKPDLALMARKDRAFLSLLQRDEPFHYKNFVQSDVQAHNTPLDVKILARFIQRQHRADPSINTGNNSDAATTATKSDQCRVSQATFDDDVLDDDAFCNMALLERDEDEFDSDEELDTSQTAQHHQSHGNRQRAAGTGGSARDQNVGMGITYAEYLLWKAKRKGDRQLEALKNSLNIQLRSVRQSHDAAAMRDSYEATEESMLTEQQFEELMASGGRLDMKAHESQIGHTPTISAAAMLEIDSLLRSSANRAEVFASTKRKYSSKCRSVSSALHFNTAVLKAAGLEEPERASVFAQSDRSSARASLVMGPVSSTTKRTSIRRSASVRPSMHSKRYSQADLSLEDAQIIAHSIVHGNFPQQIAGGAGPGLTEKDRVAVAKKGFGGGYDMQILEYIANDELILSGWESVDLLKMNDNETFSGHTFRFDDQDDKVRASTLKQFAAQIASTAEKSVAAVENEFTAAIINLNRLVGKKMTAAEVKVIALEKTVHDPATEEALSECENNSAAPTTAPWLDCPHQAIWATGDTIVQCMDRLSVNSSEAQAAETEVASSAGSADRNMLEASHPEEGRELYGGDTANRLFNDPHRPEQPRPSATFASPRKKVLIAELASSR